jgi:hypothetical protein
MLRYEATTNAPNTRIKDGIMAKREYSVAKFFGMNV